MKLHPISLLLGLAAATMLSAAPAGANDLVRVPSLPSNLFRTPVPMIPSLPSLTREVPLMRLPTNDLPTPRPLRISLPSGQRARTISLPSAVIVVGKFKLADKDGSANEQSLKRIFDKSGPTHHGDFVVVDDGGLIGSATHDPSHQILPESGLEEEIGTR